jgi:hypothetical protein
MQMASMPPSREIEQQTGLKNKTQLYVAFKNLISLKKINTGSEPKGRKKLSNQMTW